MDNSANGGPSSQAPTNKALKNEFPMTEISRNRNLANEVSMNEASTNQTSTNENLTNEGATDQISKSQTTARNRPAISNAADNNPTNSRPANNNIANQGSKEDASKKDGPQTDDSSTGLSSSESAKQEKESKEKTDFIVLLFKCLHNTATPTIVAERLMHQAAKKLDIECTLAFQTDSWLVVVNSVVKVITPRDNGVTFDMGKQQEIDRIIYQWRTETPKRHFLSVHRDLDKLMYSGPTIPVTLLILCYALATATMGIWLFPTRPVDFLLCIVFGCIIAAMINMEIILDRPRRHAEHRGWIRRALRSTWRWFPRSGAKLLTTAPLSKSNWFHRASCFTWRWLRRFGAIFRRAFLRHPVFVGPFLVVFIAQLLVMVPADYIVTDGYNCNLSGVADTRTWFCNPLSKIGSTVALLLPGFPVLIGTLELIGGHHSAGLIRIYFVTFKFITLCTSILLGLFCGSLFYSTTIEEFKHGQLRPDAEMSQESNASNVLKMHPSDEPGNITGKGFFKDPDPSNWYGILFAAAFVAFATPAFNGVVLSRRFGIDPYFCKQFLIAVGTFALHTALKARLDSYDFLPNLVKYIMDGLIIGALTVVGSLSNGFGWSLRARRQHVALAYPAMFVMLPFSLLIPLIENISDQWIHNRKKKVDRGSGWEHSFLEVVWSLATSIAGLVLGFTVLAEPVFRDR